MADRKKMKLLIEKFRQVESEKLLQELRFNSKGFIERLSEICIQIHQVGSTVTCNPPPTDTDVDYLILVNNLQDFADSYAPIREVFLAIALFEEKEYDGGWFKTERIRFEYENTEINLIITDDFQDFDRFLLASYLAKKFNLLDKQDRVELFSAVRYGNWPVNASFGTYTPSPHRVYGWHPGSK